MRRRTLVAAAGLVLSSGCAGLPVGDGEARSRLDLTVRNDRDEPVSFRVTVTDADGAVLVEESGRLDGNVGRSFDVAVGTAGRHVVAVAGGDWRGELAWSADTCARFEATVEVGDETVAVAGECLDLR